MSQGDYFDALNGLVGELAADFPAWRIERRADGIWAAHRRGWGSLYAQTASELRVRLDTYATDQDTE